MLGMLGSNLVHVTNTQRGPRPLASYLATQLRPNYRHATGVRMASGPSHGHVSLGRPAAVRQARRKGRRRLRNHAVDAVMLGCEFPSTTALENKRWGSDAPKTQRWFTERMRRKRSTARGCTSATLGETGSLMTVRTFANVKRVIRSPLAAT